MTLADKFVRCEHTTTHIPSFSKTETKERKSEK